MTIVTGFWISFTLTVIALALAFVTGRSGKRRVHLVLAPIALVLLVVAILFAERLAGERQFPELALRIHLVFAKAGALLGVPVIVTGLALWRDRRWRRAHLYCVLAFLGGVVAATGTGIYVFAHSTAK